MNEPLARSLGADRSGERARATDHGRNGILGTSSLLSRLLSRLDPGEFIDESLPFSAEVDRLSSLENPLKKPIREKAKNNERLIEVWCTFDST